MRKARIHKNIDAYAHLERLDTAYNLFLKRSGGQVLVLHNEDKNESTNPLVSAMFNEFLF